MIKVFFKGLKEGMKEGWEEIKNQTSDQIKEKDMRKLFSINKKSKAFDEIGLSEFWDLLTDKEKNILIDYNKNEGLGSIDIITDTFGTGANRLNTLTEVINVFNYKKEYKSCEKVINYIEDNKVMSYDPIDMHFFYTAAINYYYKPKNPLVYNKEKVKYYCYKDKELAEKHKTIFIEFGDGQFPFMPSFKALAIILEKDGEYQEAINICEKALKLKLHDKTKGGYEGRIQRLRKKLSK